MADNEVRLESLEDEVKVLMVGHLRGQLNIDPKPEDEWRQQIESRNRRR